MIIQWGSTSMGVLVLSWGSESRRCMVAKEENLLEVLLWMAFDFSERD
jgi:hypothetical protein